nr:MAG TPA: hypothetical protein [Caudoviricetes sp.]
MRSLTLLKKYYMLKSIIWSNFKSNPEGICFIFNYHLRVFHLKIL